MTTKFTPIWIKESTFIVRSVNSAEEGIAFLDSYAGERGAVFHLTRWTLEKATEGEVDVDQARGAFGTSTKWVLMAALSKQMATDNKCYHWGNPT